MEATRLGIEGSHCPRAVDTDQPVRFGTADGSVSEALHFAAIAQACETVPDRTLGHRLQPQSLDRLGGLGVLRDVIEDQFTFAPRVTGVDQTADILALDELGQHLEPRFGLLDR